MTKQKEQTISLIEVILAGVLWGCMGLFVRNLNKLGLSTMGVVATRGAITSVILLVYLGIFKRKDLIVKWRDLWCFLGTGICSVLFFNFCYFKTMALTSLSVAAILLYTSPIFIMIMSFFLFKERINVFKLVALILTIFGCVLVSGFINSIIGGEEMTVSPEAMLLGLGSGLGYALYSIFSRFAIKRGYSSLTITFYTFLFSSVGSLFMTDGRKIVSVMSQSVNGFALCLGIALFATLIPYLSYTAGLKGMDNGKASVVVSVEPAVASLVSFFIYHENPGLLGTIGIILVLGAIVIINVADSNQKA